MNDTVTPPDQGEPATTSLVVVKKTGGERKFALFILLILFCGSLAFFVTAPWLNQPNSPVISGSLQTLQTEIDAINKRVQGLESRVEVLSSSTPAISHDESRVDLPTTQQMNQIQNDMIGLTSAMSALQAEVRAEGNAAAQSKESAESLVASLLAFIQLRDAVNSAHAFVQELATLRDASKNDADIQEAITKLEPYSATGAPTLNTLHDELTNREAQVTIAMTKDAAQNWWERIVAEIQSLIVVRPLHGGVSDTLTQMQMTLANGNADAAMEAFNQLPDSAQHALADLHKKLEARQHVDAGIAAITSHFVAKPAVKNP